MKKITFPVILSLLLAAQCESGKKSSETKQTLSGSLKSMKGVMDEMSCYCYDGAYLTTEKGERIAVCFDKINSDSIQCFDKITLSGQFDTLSHKSSANDPCPEGEMIVFKAEEIKCQ